MDMTQEVFDEMYFEIFKANKRPTVFSYLRLSALEDIHLSSAFGSEKENYYNIYKKGIETFCTEQEFKAWFYKLEDYKTVTLEEIDLKLDHIIHGYCL